MAVCDSAKVVGERARCKVVVQISRIHFSGSHDSKTGGGYGVCRWLFEKGIMAQVRSDRSDQNIFVPDNTTGSARGLIQRDVLHLLNGPAVDRTEIDVPNDVVWIATADGPSIDFCHITDP
jgi:hypothetical protein